MVSINPWCPNHDDKEIDRGLIKQNVSEDVSLKDGYYRFRTSYSGQPGHRSEQPHQRACLFATFILLHSALPFPNPRITFFFFKKGINTCGSQQGLKNETSQQEKKNGPHSRGPIPNAPKLTFLSLTGVNVPESTSKDARLLCPKLLENEPLNDQLELPLHNTNRTEIQTACDGKITDR